MVRRTNVTLGHTNQDVSHLENVRVYLTDKNKPLVSVVTPAYNAAAIIGETIDSVLAQSYARWEMLIVDDGSTDGTREIVRSYSERDARIRLIKMPRNSGAPAKPRNTAVEAARGEWIAFLDADDIWHPLKLESQLRVLEAGQAEFSCTSMRDFRNLSEIEISDPENVQVKKITFRMQQIKGRIPASSVMLQTDVARKFSFNEDLSYKAVEDYDCWLRVLENKGPCLKLEFPFLMYRRIENQISGSKLYMLRRMHNLHLHYGRRRSPIRALLFSMTHIIGALYFRTLRRSL